MSWHDDGPPALPMLRVLEERNRLGLFDPIPASKREAFREVADWCWPEWGSDHEIEKRRRQESETRHAVALTCFCDRVEASGVSAAWLPPRSVATRSPLVQHIEPLPAPSLPQLTSVAPLKGRAPAGTFTRARKGKAGRARKGERRKAKQKAKRRNRR